MIPFPRVDFRLPGEDSVSFLTIPIALPSLSCRKARYPQSYLSYPYLPSQDPQAHRAAIAPDPRGRRRLILATPIAESSLTIEGVRIVIDSGLRKVSTFDASTGMSALVTQPISVASATQRMGRAGRVASGTVYRLWSEADEARMVEQTPPEIEQADLAPLLLTLASVGIASSADIAALPWLRPPPSESLKSAQHLLSAIGALRLDGNPSDGTPEYQPTSYARRLASLPTHPRLAHMLLSSQGHPELEKTAATLAALLGERDILIGGSREHGVDVRKRLRAMEEDAPFAVNHGACARAKREAADLLKQLRNGPGPHAGEEQGGKLEEGRRSATISSILVAELAKDRALEAGVLLSLAFSDRIGQLQPGKQNTFALSNGRGAALSSSADPLANAAYVVAPTLDGGDKASAKILLAAPLSLIALRAILSHLIEDKDEVYLAPSDGSVRARRTSRIGSLILSAEPLPAPAPVDAAPILLSVLRERGVEKTLLRPTDPIGARAREMVARVALLRSLHGENAGWPVWSEESLQEDAEIWLEKPLRKVTSLRELQNVDLASLLASTLDAGQRATLDVQAPTSIVIPSGSRAPLRYAADNEILLPATDALAANLRPKTPVLASKLQEWFGCTDLPCVGGPPGSSMSVQVHLLSPAGRPLALVSGSLADFWAGAYAQVRIEAKARYPKHPWPENPAAAEPTRFTTRAIENRKSGEDDAKAAGGNNGGGGGGGGKKKARKPTKQTGGLPKTKGGKTINAFKRRR